MQVFRSASPAALIVAALLGGTVFLAGCGGTPTRESTGEVIDDSVITSRIKAAFVADKDVSALNIAVEAFRGTVQLSGFANSITEMTRAAEIARGVTGVKAVKNDIRLKTAN